jgi:hypothetical protein
MYARGEASLIKQEFWTVFGKYMSPIPSAEGLKINWVNYRTGIKDVHFRTETLPDSAAICISVEHTHAGVRELYFEQFLELKLVLHNTLEEEWEWQAVVPLNGKQVSRIIKELPGASVLNKDHWADLISFFKPRIIALDRFWENAKYSFDSLR